MWGISKNKDRQIKGVTSAVTPFVTDTLARLGPEDLEEASSKRRYAIYYIYGAVLYLAEYDDLGKDSKAVLVTNILGEHMSVDQAAIDKLPVTEDHADAVRETQFMIEGASALRNWLTTGEREKNAAYLKELLDNPDCITGENETEH